MYFSDGIKEAKKQFKLIILLKKQLRKLKQEDFAVNNYINQFVFCKMLSKVLSSNIKNILLLILCKSHEFGHIFYISQQKPK